MFTVTVVVCDLFFLYYVYLQYICICIKFIIQCTFRSMGKDTLYIYILRIHTLVSLLQLLFFCYVSTWALCGICIYVLLELVL